MIGLEAINLLAKAGPPKVLAKEFDCLKLLPDPIWALGEHATNLDLQLPFEEAIAHLEAYPLEAIESLIIVGALLGGLDDGVGHLHEKGFEQDRIHLGHISRV